MSTTFESVQSYYFDAAPRAVFRALTEPKELVRWFLSDASLEPKPGGTFSFSWLGGYQMKSHVTVFDRDKRVGFQWRDAGPGGSIVETEVLFEVAKKGEGTLLSLRHSGFASPTHFAECASRWAYYLTNLKSVLDHGTDLRSENDW